MTMAQLQQKEEKGNALRVFQVTSGDYFVESSKGKVCYRVSIDNGNSACTCGDYNGNIQNDKELCMQTYARSNEVLRDRPEAQT